MTEIEKAPLLALFDLCAFAFAESYNSAKRQSLSDPVAVQFAQMMIRTLIEVNMPKSTDKALEDMMLKLTPGGRA